MFKSILDFLITIPTLLATPGGTILLIGLIGALGYYLHLKVIKRLSETTTLISVFKVIRGMQLSKTNIMVNCMKGRYASRLLDYNNAQNLGIDRENLNKTIQDHDFLCDGITTNIKKTINDIILNNNIPCPKTSDFNEMMEDRFESLYSESILKYEQYYNPNQYLLDLDDIIYSILEKKKDLKRNFSEIFKKYYELLHE